VDLILWRHAEAGASGSGDDQRELTSKGRMAAREIASWLLPRLPSRFYLISSPAVRALETARCLQPDPEIVTMLSTGTTPQAFLQATGWPDRMETVVAVGHQPTLGLVASLVMTGELYPWAVKKGALWWFRIRPEKGEGPVLRVVISPEILDPFP
jgi:phosphohistidine phosphatase